MKCFLFEQIEIEGETKASRLDTGDVSKYPWDFGLGAMWFVPTYSSIETGLL